MVPAATMFHIVAPALPSEIPKIKDANAYTLEPRITFFGSFAIRAHGVKLGIFRLSTDFLDSDECEVCSYGVFFS